MVAAGWVVYGACSPPAVGVTGLDRVARWADRSATALWRSLASLPSLAAGLWAQAFDRGAWCPAPVLVLCTVVCLVVTLFLYRKVQP